MRSQEVRRGWLRSSAFGWSCVARNATCVPAKVVPKMKQTSDFVRLRPDSSGRVHSITGRSLAAEPALQIECRAARAAGGTCGGSFTVPFGHPVPGVAASPDDLLLHDPLDAKASDQSRARSGAARGRASLPV